MCREPVFAGTFVWPANQRAVGFYRHLGFTVISAEGSVIFAMDLRPAACAVTSPT
jgi:ribosomal protein S18 acetylase RimI-like enzyme